jgi:hypothetical protein
VKTSHSRLLDLLREDTERIEDEEQTREYKGETN